MTAPKYILAKLGRPLIVLFLVSLTFAYAMFEGRFVAWFLFYSFLPFAGYALLLSFYPLSDFKMSRHVPRRRLVTGESMQMTITLTRRFPFPLFYFVVEERLPDGIAVITKKSTVNTLVFPGFEKEIKITYTLVSVPRGDHHFSHMEISVGDVFGLARKKQELEELYDVLVFPEILPLSLKEVLTDGESGKKLKPFNHKNNTSFISGVRDYQPGDRLAAIDWKSSAKGAGLRVKKFEESYSSHVMVLLHCESDSHLFEEMITFCASLIDAGFRKYRSIGMWFAHHDRGELTPVQGGTMHREAMLSKLARVQCRPPSGREVAMPPDGSIPLNAGVFLVIAELSLTSIKPYVQLADKGQTLCIFYFQKPGNQWTASEEEAYRYALHCGAEVVRLSSRSEWSRQRKGGER